MLAHITADGGADGEPFVAVVDHIVHSSGWDGHGTESAVERARRVAAGGPLCVRLELPGVEATLELEYRPDAGVVCDLTLLCSLDPFLPDRVNSFTGTVAAAHNRIARKYATELLQPETDPHVLMTGTVPKRVGQRSLQAMTAAVTAAALETEWLHDRIRTPLRTYLAGTARREDS
jgi:hypothetical protein